MVEAVGTRLRRARLQRGLEIDQVAEATRIRPERLADLEADDYSQFPSLTYAKSFLAKYAHFLGVDVRAELENFRVSHSISLAEYQYLSSAPPRYAPDSRLFEPRAFRVPPLLVAFLVLLVLVGLPVFAYLAVGLARLQPRSGQSPAPREVATIAPAAGAAQPSPTETLQSFLNGAPPASPAPSSPGTPAVGSQGTPTPNSPSPPAPSSTGIPAPQPSPSPMRTVSVVTAEPSPVVVAAVSPSSAPAPLPAASTAEPNVTPGDSPDARDPASLAGIDPGQPVAGAETGPAPPDGKRLEVRALRRTYIRVIRDERESEPVFSGYASPKANPIIVVKGRRFWLKVSDRRAVEVREDGQVVRGHSPNIVIN